MQASVRRAGAGVVRAAARTKERVGALVAEWGRRLAVRWNLATARGEAGMATAEYAIATLAAVAFAGLLLVIMKSDEVRGLLLGIIREALSR